MGIIQWVIIIIIAAFLVKQFLPIKGVSQVTVPEAKDKFQDKHVQFIDVRTPGEYKAKHRKPFKNIPLSELANRSKELDKNKEVVVICQSGMRSMKAAKILKKQGFEKVTNVKGGMGAWV
ncbi:rhodanese-like domain-containing protein [Lentibacillus sp. Marseille-P4043]|uniref:rhodanese-like domain-containing protein n=1 Tax=Lentibacillus sp. Marseille-P4043 TaxID=2040293 RepID=UPI000D0AD3BE|nr:rhodanese-like domain-containing protein [Lentibacillus sp. Marseille-P4043]